MIGRQEGSYESPDSVPDIDKRLPVGYRDMFSLGWRS